MKQAPLLSRPVEVASIGELGRHDRIEAGEPERQAIAAALGLIAVDSLAAELETRWLGGLILVEGRVAAAVVHTCVVSLAPAPQAIDEPIRVSFALPGSRLAPVAPKPGAEIMVDPESDEPELVAGSTIDLGAVVLEHFTLALDPYPRAPGAVLPAGFAAGEAGAAPQSPFSALAGLARRGKG